MATTSNHQTDTKKVSAARSGEAGTVDLALLERAQQLRAEQHRLETFRQRVQSFAGPLHDDVRRRVLDDYAAREALLDTEVVAVPTEKSIWHAQRGLNGADHRLALGPWGNGGITPTRSLARRCSI